MGFGKALNIEFATWSSAGSLRPHSDTVKKIPGLRPGHVFQAFVSFKMQLLSKNEALRPLKIDFFKKYASYSKFIG